MKRVLFTKLFLGKPVEEIASIGTRLGFDGIDLLVRKGFQVEPEHPEAIADAVKYLKNEGLSVPMATTDITDPTKYETERIFTAFAEHGVQVVRLGYWKYDPAIGYATILDTARKHLEHLAKLAESTGITLSIQLHGDTIHASGGQAWNLLHDHNPAHIGVYPDPGNQTVQDGRDDWRFTFDILKPWINAVGMKNGGWFPGALRESGAREWKSDWFGLADGMVPWDDIIAHLKQAGFDGLLTFHSHYEVPYGQVIDQTASDLNYIDRLLTGKGA